MIQKKCTCEKSVPGIIKHGNRQSDETGCLLCMGKIEREKAERDWQAEEFPSRIVQAWMKALVKLVDLARIPNNTKHVHRQAWELTRLEHTLYQFGYEMVYNDEGNFWQ
jgi:hypothetical protein